MRNYFILGLAIVLSSCTTTNPVAETEIEPQTPVSITTVNEQDLVEYAELNATSSFIEKSIVKASINGYIQSEPVEKGKYVHAGQVLFTLITKEARSIGNTINKLDPSFKFTGITSIRASKSGYIADLNHQKGDFVQEGEQLAIISNSNSFAFLMDVPYEFNASVRNQSTVQLLLPDGEKLNGTVSSALPSVDSLSQTQRIIIKVNPSHSIPENLIAKVRIVKNSHQNVPSLPKEAVLANETQDEFWVMKLLNDSIAVKTIVTKGMETSERVEITHPTFTPTDRIVVKGNYGLADTAKVKIVKN
jgi:multidrug efflux pump subunit AcrA (membrane-fusion protein)